MKIENGLNPTCTAVNLLLCENVYRNTIGFIGRQYKITGKAISKKDACYALMSYVNAADLCITEEEVKLGIDVCRKRKRVTA